MGLGGISSPSRRRAERCTCSKHPGLDSSSVQDAAGLKRGLVDEVREGLPRVLSHCIAVRHRSRHREGMTRDHPTITRGMAKALGVAPPQRRPCLPRASRPLKRRSEFEGRQKGSINVTATAPRRRTRRRRLMILQRRGCELHGCERALDRVGDRHERR